MLLTPSQENSTLKIPHRAEREGSPYELHHVGEFNTTISLEEKKGGSLVRDLFRENMEDLISDWDLLDIKPKNGKYIWTNIRIGPSYIAARLDRFLISSELLLDNSEISSSIIPSGFLGHKSISLTFFHEKVNGPIPFRFNPLWLKEPTAMDIIKQSWKEQVWDSPTYVWEEKLRKTKINLKPWAKKHLNPPSIEKKETIQQLQSLYQKLEESQVTEEDIVQERKLTSILHKVNRQEEEQWRLKS